MFTFIFQLTNRKLDLPELQGEIIDIAKKKCKEAAMIVGGPVIVEDTCLCFKSLGDLPGNFYLFVKKTPLAVDSFHFPIMICVCKK